MISPCPTRVPGKEFLALVIRLLSFKLHTLPQNGLLFYFMIRMSYLVKDVWFLRWSQEVLSYWQRLISNLSRSHKCPSLELSWAWEPTDNLRAREFCPGARSYDCVLGRDMVGEARLKSLLQILFMTRILFFQK